MARVTVEDCLQNVENRFDLVIKAAKRAHLLEMGAVDPVVPGDNDKPTVIALREIAAGVDISNAKEEIGRGQPVSENQSEESSQANVDQVTNEEGTQSSS